ncbi:MAG: 5-formyltetrahydrofolate cyclo-ligase [Deltaproteobacteria bacterium]
MNKSALKKRLRSHYLEMRREMAFEEVWRLSAIIQKRFLETPIYRRSGRLSLYSSFKNEVLTDELFRRAVADGKEVCYPRVGRSPDRHLVFHRVTDLKSLVPGAYDIPEPAGVGPAVDPSTFDLIVVPGVAFDAAGARIGYGNGYYDIALQGCTARVVGLAYESQVLKEIIPVEAHDVRVSAIITEKRVVEV